MLNDIDYVKSRLSQGLVFDIGILVRSPGAIEKLTFEDMYAALENHVLGKWGHVTEQDRLANDQAINGKDGIFSLHYSAGGLEFQITTDGHRQFTTIFLVSELLIPA